MSSHPNAPAEGEILAGKYRVERVLGAGGMGVVVAAMHLVLGQRVAIKFLLQNATTEVVGRFLREARAAVRLRSQHVARVIDVGELANGAPYMVMEYLEGSDLSQVVRSRGPLPIDEAISHVLQACEGVAEAHSLGIIHRDLKPANLFLTTAADGSNTVKVLDFGISKTMEDPSEGDEMQLTKTTAVLGSPLYMSPEQLRSARGVTAQSDIWSIGAILHQLITGQVPFHTTTFTDLVLMVNTQQLAPMATLRADVPPQVEAAIRCCLEKSRDARFASVGELAWAIADFGPPDARAVAERISRTLEGAGLKVQRPPGYAPYQPGGPMSQRTATSPQTAGSGPTSSALAVSLQAPASSGAGPAQSTTAGTGVTLVGSRPASRAPILIAVLVAVLALAGVAVLLVLRGPELPASATEAVAATNPPSQPATTPPSPVITPASAATSSGSAEPPVALAPPATARPIATAALGPKTAGPAPVAPAKTAATATATVTKKSNPLDIPLMD